MNPNEFDRRKFIERSAAAGAAFALGGALAASADENKTEEPPPQPSPQGGGSKTSERVAQGAGSQTRESKRIRVGVIGCGSVSGAYLPDLAKCPYAEVVSTCDIIPERAERRAQEFGIANHYPHIDKMLAGVPFDLMVNLTDMQEHEHLNRQAVAAGKHVWSEKPIANSLAAGQTIVREARRARPADLGRADRGGQPAVCLHGAHAGRRQAGPRGVGPCRLRSHRPHLVVVLLRKGRRQHARFGRL